MKDIAKIERIHEELKQAGMSNYGLMKVPTKHLPELIQDDENIKGVVYGRMDENFGSVMLVATTKKIIFLDYKPLYRNSDEITYDVVAGIQLSTVGMFAGVVLHTRVRDYTLKFVNIKCAEIFTSYIEKHLEKGSEFKEKKTLEKADLSPPVKSLKTATETEKSHDKNIILDTNTAVLSTVGSDGNPHATVIHYIIDKEENYYFVTKRNTTKAKNISHNSVVVLTIHHTDSLKSLLIKGNAIEVQDPDVLKSVYNEIVRPRNYLEGKKLPPITKLGLDTYIAYQVTPDISDLQDFSMYSW